MKKTLAALALAGSIMLIGSAPAMAVTPSPSPTAEYPAPEENGEVSDGTVEPGEDFTFSGEGFTPGESILVTATPADSPQATGGSFSGVASMAVPAKIVLPLAPLTFTTTARADGTFAIPLSLPTEGTYILTAVGQTSGTTVTAAVTVDSSAGGPPNNDGVNPGNNDGTGTGTGTGTGNGTGTNVAPQGNNVSPGTTTDSDLADTGANTNLVLWSLVGAAALAAGIISVVVVRRRAKAGSTE